MTGRIEWKSLLAGLAALFGAPFAAIADAAEPASAYFAALPFRETPFDPLVGIHPIDRGEAMQRNHFRFDYDAQGRPVRVGFMLGERFRDLNDSANYYFWAPRVDITYEPGAEIRRFYDRHGNRITADGDVFTEIFEIDDRGYRRSLRFLDVNGQPAANSWGVVRYEWSVRHDGIVVERRYTADGVLAPLRSGFPFFEVRFHYGPHGWTALMQNFGHDSALTMNELNAAQDRLEFAANGDLLSWNVLDAQGNLARGNAPDVARGVLERNAFGLEVVERYQDEHGAAIESAYGWGFTRSAYDRFGNRVERANYTLDGERLLVSAERGYAGYRAEYDDTGLLQTRISFFDAARRPAVRVGQGHHRIGYAYDSRGNRVSMRYEDADGRLVNRLDSGVAQIDYAYDERGRLVETRYRDAAGAPVANSRGEASERRTYADHGVPVSVTLLDANGARLLRGAQ